MLFFHYVTRNLLRRFGNNALTIVVIGCVLAGAVLGAEFLLGLRAASRDSLPADHVIVLSKGALSEGFSGLDAGTVNELQVLPGILETNGVRAVAGEVTGSVLLSSEFTGSGINEPQVLRGLEPSAFALHGAKIIEGHAPSPGAAELVIGVQLKKMHPKVGIGTTIKLPTGPWSVVGVFAANGSVYESEAWGDRTPMMAALKLDRLSSLVIAATSPATAVELVKTINDSKRFDATAQLERQARGSQAKLDQVTRVISILVLALCIIGIFVTATNLHASLISRLPELVTLIALGVPRGRVARMIVMESLLLAGLGLCVALALALLFNGQSSALFNAGALFELKLGLMPILFVSGFALLVGVLGGLVPSLMVRRIDLVRGLR